MRVTNYKPVENGGALIGKFDVDLDNITIHSMCLFSNSKGSIWISEPSDKWTDRQGEVHYTKHVNIKDSSLKTEISNQVKQILFDRDAAAGISEPQPDLNDQDIPF